MSREELLKSDEYITGYVDCLIVSGKGIKQTRKEITEKWLAYRDELLAFQLHPSPTPAVTEAVEFLTWVDGNGFECVLHDDENIKHWQAYKEGESYTTQQLYSLFKNQKQ